MFKQSLLYSQTLLATNTVKQFTAIIQEFALQKTACRISCTIPQSPGTTYSSPATRVETFFDPGLNNKAISAQVAVAIEQLFSFFSTF
jgi:hypothetical protein